MITGRLLGIDHGLKRIGLAVSDVSGFAAQELAIIKRKSKVEDFRRINHVAQEQKVVAFVIGIPNNETLPGVYSQADTVRRWVENFAQTTSLPLILWDEQLSSIDAHVIAHRQRRKPRDPVDDLAARVILQSYLDAVRDGLADFPSSET